MLLQMLCKNQSDGGSWTGNLSRRDMPVCSLSPTGWSRRAEPHRKQHQDGWSHSGKPVSHLLILLYFLFKHSLFFVHNVLLYNQRLFHRFASGNAGDPARHSCGRGRPRSLIGRCKGTTLFPYFKENERKESGGG